MARQFNMTIDGGSASAAEYLEIRNPSTGAVVGLCPSGTAGHLDRAVEAAERAFRTWRHSGDAERQSACQSIAQVVRDNARELAVLLTE